MIKANHKNFWIRFSNIYSKLLLDIFFRGIKYIGEYEKTNLPVLVISNHFSWWDGFILIQLNNKFFKRRLHFMMLERELRKSMMLTKIGAFSIKKERLSSIESLNYSLEIIQDPQNLFFFFPQGKISSIYTNEFIFEKGVLMYILKNMQKEFQFVFNVNLIDYSSYRKPEISVYFKNFILEKNTSVDDIESAYNQFANECLTKQRGR